MIRKRLRQARDIAGVAWAVAQDLLDPTPPTPPVDPDDGDEEDWQGTAGMLEIENVHLQAEIARLRGQVETLTGAAVHGAAFADGVTVDLLMEIVKDAAGEEPGTWSAASNGYGHNEVWAHRPARSILTGPRRVVTEYVAAFNPVRVAAMLLEIKRLTLRDDLSTEKIASLEGQCRAHAAQTADARADVERLRAERAPAAGPWKRYDIGVGLSHGARGSGALDPDIDVTESPDGEWVRYEDVWRERADLLQRVEGFKTHDAAWRAREANTRDLVAKLLFDAASVMALRDQIEHAGCAVSRLGERTYECPADAPCGLCRLRNERDTARQVIALTSSILDPQLEGPDDIVVAARDVVAGARAAREVLAEVAAILDPQGMMGTDNLAMAAREIVDDKQHADTAVAAARFRLDAADRQAMRYAHQALVDIRDLVRVDGYERPLAGRAVEIISNLLADDGGRGPAVGGGQ